MAASITKGDLKEVVCRSDLKNTPSAGHRMLGEAHHVVEPQISTTVSKDSDVEEGEQCTQGPVVHNCKSVAQQDQPSARLRRIPSAPTELARESNKINGSARESDGSPRIVTMPPLSLNGLGKRSSRFDKRDQHSVGQMVHLDVDNNCLDHLSSDAVQQERGEDLEVAQTCPKHPGVENCKSIERQDLLPTTDGLKKQSSAETVWGTWGSSGGQSRLGAILLEQSSFTVYKRLLIASLGINLTCLILAATGRFPYANSKPTRFSLGNILMCVLVRSEVFLRALFWLAVYLLGYRWIPVKLKTMTTAVLQSVGGIHSGCGLGAVLWLVYALVPSFQNRRTGSGPTLAVACGVLFLLLLSSLAAFPVLRHTHHNVFERVHRFAGWSSLGLVWVYIVLSTFWNPVNVSYHVSGEELMRMLSLWLTVATTILVILPWLTVRKVAVETVIPPTKLNALLHFEGGVEAGLLARISPSPFSEWHAFGIISDGKNRHTVVAGAVGDFTKSLVQSPPTHIWVRTFHFAGLPYLTNMYQKALLVATGSGICVFLSFLLQASRAEVHMIWIAKRIRESYGDGIWTAISKIPSENLTLIDTAVSGRPKTRELVVTKARDWRAEVVIVTSNPIGTNDVLNGCKAAGIPAFGPIWDS